MQHEKPELMELGLESMNALANILSESPQYATIFYQSFYTKVLSETLSVITDYRHVSGFKLQGMILQQLLQAVDRPDLIDVATKLVDAKGVPHTSTTNKEFVMAFLTTHLLEMFPNLNKV